MEANDTNDSDREYSYEPMVYLSGVLQVLHVISVSFGDYTFAEIYPRVALAVHNLSYFACACQPTGPSAPRKHRRRRKKQTSQPDALDHWYLSASSDSESFESFAHTAHVLSAIQHDELSKIFQFKPNPDAAPFVPQSKGKHVGLPVSTSKDYTLGNALGSRVDITDDDAMSFPASTAASDSVGSIVSSSNEIGSCVDLAATATEDGRSKPEAIASACAVPEALAQSDGVAPTCIGPEALADLISTKTWSPFASYNRFDSLDSDSDEALPSVVTPARACLISSDPNSSAGFLSVADRTALSACNRCTAECFRYEPAAHIVGHAIAAQIAENKPATLVDTPAPIQKVVVTTAKKNGKTPKDKRKKQLALSVSLASEFAQTDQPSDLKTIAPTIDVPVPQKFGNDKVVEVTPPPPGGASLESGSSFIESIGMPKPEPTARMIGSTIGHLGKGRGFDREHCIGRIYSALAGKRKCIIDHTQFLPFALASGFDGDLQCWQSEYSSLCCELGSIGRITLSQFKHLVDDTTDDGCYCDSNSLSRLDSLLSSPFEELAEIVKQFQRDGYQHEWLAFLDRFKLGSSRDPRRHYHHSLVGFIAMIDTALGSC